MHSRRVWQSWLSTSSRISGSVSFSRMDMKVPLIETFAVKPELRSAAAVVEALRWFEQSGSSHLLWLLSPRVEVSASGLQRLAQVAADSRAAIVYSDYFDRQAAGGVKLHPLID